MFLERMKRTLYGGSIHLVCMSTTSTLILVLYHDMMMHCIQGQVSHMMTPEHHIHPYHVHLLCNSHPIRCILLLPFVHRVLLQRRDPKTCLCIYSTHVDQLIIIIHSFIHSSINKRMMTIVPVDTCICTCIY